jgi:hypothetical protein
MIDCARIANRLQFHQVQERACYTRQGVRSNRPRPCAWAGAAGFAAPRRHAVFLWQQWKNRGIGRKTPYRRAEKARRYDTSAYINEEKLIPGKGWLFSESCAAPMAGASNHPWAPKAKAPASGISL